MMSGLGSAQTAAGRAELGRIKRELRGLLMAAIVFSVFVNLLMLTGPLYMLQVYDRVLGSRSEETLVALSVLVVVPVPGDGAAGSCPRAQSWRASARGFRPGSTRRVFDATLRRWQHVPRRPGWRRRRSAISMRCSSFCASPVLLALMDMPWTPVFHRGDLPLSPDAWLAGVGGGAVLIVRDAAQSAASARPRSCAPTVAESPPNAWPRRLKAEAEAGARARHDRGRLRAGPPRAARRWRQHCSADLVGAFIGATQHLPAVPAIGDAGARRLAGAARRDDRRGDDRRLDPAGPRACPDRAGGRAMGGGAARRRRAGASGRAA